MENGREKSMLKRRKNKKNKRKVGQGEEKKEKQSRTDGSVFKTVKFITTVLPRQHSSC